MLFHKHEQKRFWVVLVYLDWRKAQRGNDLFINYIWSKRLDPIVWKDSWFWIFTHFGAIKSPRRRCKKYAEWNILIAPFWLFTHCKKLKKRRQKYVLSSILFTPFLLFTMSKKWDFVKSTLFIVQKPSFLSWIYLFIDCHGSYTAYFLLLLG